MYWRGISLIVMAWGDCLLGSQFVTASGGFRDSADEGAHPFDIAIVEDSAVFKGLCGSGCRPGSTVVTVTPTAGSGTARRSRFQIDTNSAKVLTAGAITGAEVRLRGRL